MAIEILLVDGSQQFLQAARKFIRTVPDLPVAGAATAGLERLRMTIKLQPNLVLLDFKMASGNGVDAARRIKQLQPPPRIIRLTLHDAAEYRAAGAARPSRCRQPALGSITLPKPAAARCYTCCRGCARMPFGKTKPWSPFSLN